MICGAHTVFSMNWHLGWSVPFGCPKVTCKVTFSNVEERNTFGTWYGSVFYYTTVTKHK